jgi:protein-tyrosine phosphatase
MRVLFVCLGNICRSPTAEGVFREVLRRDDPALARRCTIDSAGTADYHIGAPPDRRTVAAALARGYDLSNLRARQVESEDFEQFDLLLAMDRANAAELRARAPSRALERIRLFLEFAPQVGLDEVPDPYYGSHDDFVRVIDLAEAGARGLLAHVKRA